MVSQHITSVRSFFMMYNIALEGHFADMLLKFTVSLTLAREMQNLNS